MIAFYAIYCACAVTVGVAFALVFLIIIMARVLAGALAHAGWHPDAPAASSQ
jgi:hypothetical protein